MGQVLEGVRLVVWDLDETFWKGTLTEGSIIVSESMCDLVKELAARGIISSICSKNDFHSVKAILEEANVWEYFIFASINWDAKGLRVKNIIERTQLRASTVMFIDDNPLNLEEVLHFNPGIQVQSQEFIPGIKTNDLFKGKDDRALSRLKQYKIMEARFRDQGTVVHQDRSNVDFLRSSGIKVTVDYEVESQLPRLIELINRTNQLNFTKVRLSEDIEEAEDDARQLLKRYNTAAGLVSVVDRYGDHGVTGAYVIEVESNTLIHFCFSCRILGMGVERWLYEMLGRPRLKICGEVLTDPTDASWIVDWINCDDSDIQQETGSLRDVRIVAHGGCDLSAIAHYFSRHQAQLVPEFNTMRNGISLRPDHSIFLSYALDGLTSEQLATAEKLQYRETDFRTALLGEETQNCYALLSLTTDAHYALYRHKANGLIVPCVIAPGPVMADQREAQLAQPAPPVKVNTQALLKSEFDFIGLIEEDSFKTTLQRTFTKMKSWKRVFVVQPSEYTSESDGGRRVHPLFANVNRWTKEVAINFPIVELISLRSFAESEAEVSNILHYDRKVYFRAQQYIENLIFTDMAEEFKS